MSTLTVTTKLGTPVELLSRADLESFVWVRFQYSTGPEIGQIRLIDLRAPGGMTQIDEMLKYLPSFHIVQHCLKKKEQP